MWQGSWSQIHPWENQGRHAEWITNCTQMNFFQLSSNYKPHVVSSEFERTLSFFETLRHSSWLMIGTSIDLSALKLVCDAFQTEQELASLSVANTISFVEGQDSTRIVSCKIPIIDFRMSYIFGEGMFSHRGLQFDAHVFEARLKRIREVFAARQWATPQHITVSGIEWDLKYWNHANPKVNATEIVDQLTQIVRRQPAHATFRTMFKSTYRGFSGDAELLGTLNAAVLNTQKGVHLARLVMYENGTCMHGAPSGHGTCSSLSRWTMDGLHPPNWLLKVYIRLCLLKLKRDGTMTNTREKYKDYC
jgi:hypothetical protein